LLQSLATAPAFASYALAYRLGAPVATLGASAKTAINPTLFRTRDLDHATQFMERITGLSIAALGVAVCLIAGIIGLIITTMLGDAYARVYPIFLAMSFGFFLRSQEHFLNVGADVTMRQGDRTKLMIAIILLQTAVMTVLTVVWGLFGAVGAFIINSIIRTLATTVQAHRMLPRKFPAAAYVATNVGVIAVLVLWYYVFSVGLFPLGTS
jgi:O-antigen/teichoic acid export membrane protein